MIFENRFHAGERLADEFQGWKLKQPIAVAIPPGGILVGTSFAEKLGCELDVICPVQLPIPFNPEASFGVVAVDGTVILNDEILWEITLKQNQIDQIKEERLNEARRLERFYRGVRKKPELQGRDVVLLDDGSSDVLTLITAARSMRNQEPKTLIFSAPVLCSIYLEKLEPEVDEVIRVLTSRTWLYQVQTYYTAFDEIGDEPARQILRDFWKKKK